MSKILLPFLFNLLFLFPATAQDRIVSGTLTNDTGEPLPGVNIIVKGTSNGTATDANGFYSLRASLGDILVVSFIGYTSSEVVVTEDNSQPTSGSRSRPAIPISPKRYLPGESTDTLLPKGGVARLGSSSPGFVVKGSLHPTRGIPETTRSIRYLNPARAIRKYGTQGQNGMLVVKLPKYHRPFQLSLTTSFTLDEVNKLPTLQNQYAQGRPVDGKESWRGPQTGEVFSWGPRLSTLEYSGAPDAYDPNGSLTLWGTGNGQRARAYDPTRFFRIGTTFDQTLTLSKSSNYTTYSLGYQTRNQQGILPTSDLYRNTFYGKLNTRRFSKFELDFALSYSNNSGSLQGKGANLASVISAVYLTPPSFDNAQGFSRREALRNPLAYQWADGSPRTYSPTRSDNPYWLVNQMPDEQRLSKVVSSLGLQYTPKNFQFHYLLGMERQGSRNTFGTPPQSTGLPEGWLTQRQEQADQIHSSLSASYKPDQYWNRKLYAEATLSHDFNYSKRELDRQDGSGFAPQTPFQLSQARSMDRTSWAGTRNVHELKAGIKLNHKEIVHLNLSSRSYFSNTYGSGKPFLPNLGVNFTFTELGPFRDVNFLSHGRIRASYSKTVKEAPLIYSRWQYQPTTYGLDQYLGYYESPELFISGDLQPEQIQQFETGINLSFFNNRLGLEFNYFRKLTQNAIYPVYQGNEFRLTNTADVLNRGFEFDISYANHGYNSLYWTTKVHFTRLNPVVQSVYGERERIPLSGFREVTTNLVAGQPFGQLYGSAFLRTPDGQLLIGNDGFPQVDPQARPIGNPNPDFTAGLENSLNWKKLSFSLVIDFRKGGAVWNGTQQALNYYGVSQLSAEQRNIRSHIFEGVRADRTPNTQSVDLANPAKDVEENYWVRYGLGGVAEQAIQDGSWIRLQELKLTYRFNKLLPRFLPRSEVDLSLIGKNLLLITPYSGVDPTATLFGYESGMGLDFFNVPNTRSYGLSLSVKL